MANKSIGRKIKTINTKIGVNTKKRDGFSRLSNMYIDLQSDSGELSCIPGYKRLIRLKEMPRQVVCEGEYLIAQLSDGVYLIDLSKETAAPRKIAGLASDERLIKAGDVCFVSNERELFTLDLNGERMLVSKDKALAGCRAGAINRGMTVLGGNPEMAEKIFFSAPHSGDSISLENYSFESLGLGIKNIEYILSFGGYIWLFINCKSGDGMVLCYSCEEDLSLVSLINTDKILSTPIIRKGEILLVTAEGIMALSLKAGDENGLMSYRFLTVDHPLPLTEGKPLTLGAWRGYIALSYEDKILLLRESDGVCDCFPLKNIVGYLGDERVYRYSDMSEEGYDTHKSPHTVAKGIIMSKMNDSGSLIYYSREDKKSYSVYPTEQLHKGERIVPEKYIFAHNEILFYTQDGSIYRFNDGEISSSDIYSFAGHSIECEAEGEIMDLSDLGGTRERAECSLNGEIQATKAMSVEASIFSAGKTVKRDILKFNRSDGEGEGNQGFCIKTRLTCQKTAYFKLKAQVFHSPFSIKALSVEARKT